MCLGRPQAQPCWAKSARSQPGERRTPVCCSKWADSRSDVHTSKAKPTCVGGVSSALSMAARYASSACTGRPERGASESAATPPAAKHANQRSTVSTERPLQRAMRPTSSPSAAALIISSRSRTRRVKSVRRSCRSTSSLCLGVTVMPMAALPVHRVGLPGPRVPRAYSLPDKFTSAYLAWLWLVARKLGLERRGPLG